MPAVANSAAAPAPAPQPIPPLRAKPAGARWRWVPAIAIGIGLCAAAIWWLLPKPSRRSAMAPALRTFRVAPVTFERTVRVAGSTSARNFANIVAPMMRAPDSGRGEVLIRLVNSGALVKKGDLLAEIDPQAVQDHEDDIAALVVQAEGDIRKLKADQAISEETLAQTVRAAKAALDKAKIDFSAQEIRTSIDQEELKLSVDEAQANYEELLKEVNIEKQSDAANIRILELTRDRHARHRDRHRADIQKFKIYAPMSGLTVMQSIWRGGDMGQVQLGDQITPGQPFMKIVDTNTMQLEASLNQVETEGIRLGLPVELHFDAFPDLKAQGHVYSVGALAAGGWRLNYYIRSVPVDITIDTQDRRVIPDLSASGNIVLDRKENVLAVPLEALFQEGGKTVVYVRQRDRFQARPVETGERNGTQAVVLAGLAAGDEIAMGRTAAR
jgi:HlyD family secretion protein